MKIERYVPIGAPIELIDNEDVGYSVKGLIKGLQDMADKTADYFVVSMGGNTVSMRFYRTRTDAEILDMKIQITKDKIIAEQAILKSLESEKQ